jgi:inner membrane protein
VTSSSHLAGAAVFYLVYCALTEDPVSIEGLAATAAGSLLPDIDTPTSSIGRPLFPLARRINEKLGHRTATHSLLGVAVFALAAGALEALARATGLLSLDGFAPALCLALGYLSHVLIDTVNKTGVELFWPSRLRCVFFLGERYRIASGGAGDYWFMVGTLVLALAMYPVARDGFTRSLHRAFGDVHSVAMDFRAYGDTHRIWVHLEAIERLSNQKMSGRFEVLAVVPNAGVLIDRDGVKQIVSRSDPFHLFPLRAWIEIGEPREVVVREVDMAGRTLGEIPEVEGADRELLYGYLTPVKQVSLGVRRDRYDSLSPQLDKLRLEHAERRDIAEQGFEHVLIVEGVLIQRVCRPPPGESPGPEPEVEPERDPPGRIRSLEFRLKPGDELLFAEGERIEPGQPLIRRDVAEEMEKLEFDYERDLERLRQREVEPEERLAAALVAQREAVENRADASLRLRALPGPLFAAESLRLRQALVAADREIARESARIDKARRDLAKLAAERAQRAAEHRHSLARLQERALVRATFTGTVTRVERTPTADGHHLVVFYREFGHSGDKTLDRSTREPVHETLPHGARSVAGTTTVWALDTLISLGRDRYPSSARPWPPPLLPANVRLDRQ